MSFLVICREFRLYYFSLKTKGRTGKQEKKVFSLEEFLWIKIVIFLLLYSSSPFKCSQYIYLFISSIPTKPIYVYCRPGPHHSFVLSWYTHRNHFHDWSDIRVQRLFLAQPWPCVYLGKWTNRWNISFCNKFSLITLPFE